MSGAVARRAFASRAVAALGGLVVALALSVPGAVRAAEVPGFERGVKLMAREQPIDLFLEQLFGDIDVPVRIDESVVGTVNGDFDKSAAEVFDDIRGAFQIALYYDGAVAHVYPSNSTTRSVLYLPAGLGERVVASARQMGLTDAHNRLETNDVGLVVTGVQRFVEQVEELAEAVQRGAGIAPAAVTSAEVPVPAAVAPDASAAESSYRVFTLRYAWAEDTTVVVGGQEVVVPGVASLLRELVGAGGMTVAPVATRRQLERTLPGLRGEGLRSIGRRDGTDGGADGGAGDAADGVADGSVDGRVADGGAGGGTGGEAALVAPGALSGDGVGDVRIVANSLQNAVVIRDRPERMAGYESLIASLDVEPSMIEIEATIIDLDTDRLRELGVSLRAEYVDGDTLAGADVGAPDTPASALGDAAGGVVSLILGDESRFLSRIRALETQGAARVVSKPHVITLTNVEAVLETISTFFVRVAGREEVDLFDVSVGTTLRVTPHVFRADGRSQIKLLVAIEDGSTLDQSVDSIPVIKRSSINTQALIDGGESLLIGGLVRELDGNTVSKVPLLGDLPGVGALFRSTSRSASRVERLFLISPRLSVRPDDGPRYSAPVIWGDESEIIATSPARTRAATLGLARRDERYPLTEPLPPGGADVRLIPRGYDIEAETAAREASRAALPAPREPSLRERLLGLPPGQGTSPDGSPAVPPSPLEPGPGMPSEPRWQVRAEDPDRRYTQDEGSGASRGLGSAQDIAPDGEGWIEMPGTAPAGRQASTGVAGTTTATAFVGGAQGGEGGVSVITPSAAPLDAWGTVPGGAPGGTRDGVPIGTSQSTARAAALAAEEAAWRADGWQEIAE